MVVSRSFPFLNRSSLVDVENKRELTKLLLPLRFPPAAVDTVVVETVFSV